MVRRFFRLAVALVATTVLGATLAAGAPGHLWFTSNFSGVPSRIVEAVVK